MTVKYFEDLTMTHAIRASQCYPYLIANAHFRRITTYTEIRDLLGVGGAGIIGPYIGALMYWAEDNVLPVITSICVNDTPGSENYGAPGSGLNLRGKPLHVAQAEVFAYEWYLIVPPTIEELTTALQNRKVAA